MSNRTPPDRERLPVLKGLQVTDPAKKALPAGPETGAVPFPHQKAKGRSLLR